MGEEQACLPDGLRGRATALPGPCFRTVGRQSGTPGSLPASLDSRRWEGAAAAGEEGPRKAVKVLPNKWPFSKQLILLQKQRLSRSPNSFFKKSFSFKTKKLIYVKSLKI